MAPSPDEPSLSGIAPALHGDASISTPLTALVARHLRVGWGALCVFVTFGIALEALHAWKVGAYLDVGNETRRLMWTLAHAHGIGLALLNIGYAATLRLLFRELSSPLVLASRLTIGATCLIPLGFGMGGVRVYGGDPGPLVLLVPLGAFMLWLAVVLVAREVWRAGKRA